VYTISTAFYLLHDAVTKSSAISLPLKRNLEFAPHHQCPYIATGGVGMILSESTNGVLYMRNDLTCTCWYNKSNLNMHAPSTK